VSLLVLICIVEEGNGEEESLIEKQLYLWQAADELIRKSLSTGLLHHFFLQLQLGILPLGADKSKLNIIVYGIVEEKGLLLNEADLAAPPLEIDLSQRPSSCSNQAVAKEQALQSCQ
jgi:hypothetical protein